MLRALSCIALTLLMTLFLSAAPPDDKTDSSSKKDDAKPARKTAKVQTDIVKGKLIKIDSKQGTLTVQVTKKIPQANNGAAQNIANIQRQLLTTRDINTIRSLKLDLMKQEQNLTTYKDDVKNIELTTDDDLKVRTKIEPVEYDDKGKPRKLTEKERKALKGSDTKAPGYEADFDSLKRDQTVEVYVARPKKQKSKDAEADGKEPQKAVMIVIVSEPVK